MKMNIRKKVIVWLTLIALVLNSFILYGNDISSDMFLGQIDQLEQTTPSMYTLLTDLSTSSAIVINGSFDEGLTGWTEPTYGTPGTHFKLNTTEGYQGGNCAQLITGNRAIEQKLTGLEPYSAYVLKVWARLGNSATGRIEIGCENNGSAKKTITTTSKTYTQLEVTFATGNQTTANIYVYMPTGTTEAYVDNFEVTATTLPPIDAGTITINPAEQYQNFDGWGTSLVWFGHAIGGWSEENRKAISDLIFDVDKGLGFNIIRYNIGGGDDPTHNHLRPGADVPGFATGFDGNGNLIYDWTADANQIKMLKDALERNVTITEAFSNSPPYFMTVSGCSSGSVDKSSNNLKDEYYEAFADYLTEVTKHFRDNENITFDYLEPLNEPDTNYWGAYGGQEGCHFDPDKQEEIIQLTHKSLQDKNLTGTVVAAMDESVLDKGLTNFLGFSQKTKDSMAKWNIHTYGGSKRKESKNAAALAGKDLWMSEVDLGGGKYNPDSIFPGIEFAKRVSVDVRNIQPTAWCIWQAVENWPNMMPSKENQNWGLILANFEGQDKGGLDAEDFRTTKKYYAMMQYSKFIKPGSVMLGTPNDNMVAFYNKTDKQLVFVVINDEVVQPKKIDFNLQGFDSLGNTAKVYRTSKSHDCEKTADIMIHDGILSDEMSASSINTYIVDNVEYGDQVLKLNESTVSKTLTGNRFEYSGTWGYYGSQGGAYTSDNVWSQSDTSKTSLYFYGKQAKIYAAKANGHGIAKISIDGGEPVLVDLYSPTRMEASLIYETPVLENKEHVILIEATGTKNALATGTPIALDYAEIYSDKKVSAITIKAIKEQQAITKVGTAPILATQVEVTHSDATTKQLPVIWDIVAASQYAAAGSFVVEGIVEGTALKAKTTVTVEAVQVPPTAVASITLDKAAASVTAGQNVQLTAIVLPADATNKTVAWSTSNAAVATVDDQGKVTAVKAGTATITAIADDDLKATCVVTVTVANISVTVVTLNKASTLLVVGNTETLTATVGPVNATNKAVTWSTNNAAVATVDAATGKVTAVKAGTATITVTTADGSKTAACVVTVSNNSGGSGRGGSTVTPPVVPTETTQNNGGVKVSLSLIDGTASEDGVNIQLTVKPYIEQGRTMAGIRDIANIIQIENKNIVWNNKTKEVTIKRNEKEIKLIVNQKYAMVDGKKVDLDVAPQIKHGRTVLPIANIARLLGIKVEFDEKTKEVMFSIEK